SSGTYQFRLFANNGFTRIATSNDFTVTSSVVNRLPGIAAMDFDGDGRADLTIYRPSTGGWHTLLSTTSYTTSSIQLWGVSTDVPVPGDYDGDGKPDIAVYRPSTGGWYILTSTTNYNMDSSISVGWGVDTDTPVPGDYDGDGKTDIAVY